MYPIHLGVCVYQLPCRYYPIETPINVHKDEWMRKNVEWVKNIHPYFFEINNGITELITKIREITRKGARSLLNEYFGNYIDHPPKNVRLDPVTWEKYKALLMYLNNFNPKRAFGNLDETIVGSINYLADQKEERAN